MRGPPSLKLRRDNFREAKVGGAERDRTAGLLVANEALSQLSYSPTRFLFYQRAWIRERDAYRAAQNVTRGETIETHKM